LALEIDKIFSLSSYSPGPGDFSLIGFEVLRRFDVPNPKAGLVFNTDFLGSVAISISFFESEMRL
jgi:hypothetical protein